MTPTPVRTSQGVVEQVLFAKEPQWVVFHQDGARRAEPFEALERVSRIVWCPGTETVGVVSLNGKPQFAAVLIERQLRQSGEIDGETKVLVHQTLRHRDSYMAFYSAVPLQQWQRFQSWLETQPVLCIAFSWLTLLHHGLEEGGARVVQDGVRLLYLARDGRQFAFFNVVAFSDGAEDLESAGRSLALQVLQSQTDRRSAARPEAGVPVEWVSMLSHGGGCGAAQRGFEQAFGATCRIVQQSFRADDGPEPFFSGLPLATAVLHPRQTIGPRLDGWLYTLERMAAPAAGLLIAVGVALAMLGASWLWEADKKQAEALKVEGTVASMADRQQGPARVSPVREDLSRQLVFQQDALGLVEGVDLHHLLDALHGAGSGRVRILSVRLEERTVPKGSAAAAAPPPGSEVFIEGLLPEAREPGDAVLSGFVQQLNAVGWRVEPAEYRGGNSSNGSMAGRLFAFKLLSTPSESRP